MYFEYTKREHPRPRFFQKQFFQLIGEFSIEPLMERRKLQIGLFPVSAFAYKLYNLTGMNERNQIGIKLTLSKSVFGQVRS